MKKRQYTFPQIASAICIVIFFFILFLPGLGAVNVRAETAAGTVYDNSSILKDLQKSSDFEIEDYPYDPSDYSIYVIQVAESDKGFLYLYTYQPCQIKKPLTATQINMSLAESVTGTQLYDLQQVSTNGVFAKYLVKGVTVSDSFMRYYNISSIYRNWDEQLDGKNENNNTKNAKTFTVGKVFGVITVDGVPHYYCKQTDVVEIINPYVDFLSYYNGVTWGGMFGLEGTQYTDVHYIAFSTDHKIDTLKKAEVTYRTQPYSGYRGEIEPTGELSDPQYVTLTGDTTGNTSDRGLFAQTYSWKSIQHSEDFIKSTDLNSATEEIVKQSEFVLIFLTTQYSEKQVMTWAGHRYELNGTLVKNVAILRLEFETDGVVYNLGTVMDQQQSDNIPGNDMSKEPNCNCTDMGMWWWLIVLILILLLIIFAPSVLSIIFTLITKLFTVLIKAVVWLITAPFKALRKLFKKKKK